MKLFNISKLFPPPPKTPDVKGKLVNNISFLPCKINVRENGINLFSEHKTIKIKKGIVTILHSLIYVHCMSFIQAEAMSMMSI